MKKIESGFAPKQPNKHKGQIQLSEGVKREIINAYLEESQRTPNKSAALTTYKETDKTVAKFYDEYCMRKPLKNKKNEPTKTERSHFHLLVIKANFF